jgi:cold shock CspA family protein
MIEGKIISYNSIEGRGRISRDDGGGDVVVFGAEMQLTPSVGDRVLFQVVPSSRGPKAIRVKPLVDVGLKRHTGRVLWFDGKRGFGRILSDEGLGELYVHLNQLKLPNERRKLYQGELVCFDVVQDALGTRAVKVQTAQRADASA